jgi:hypothetical protein
MSILQREKENLMYQLHEQELLPRSPNMHDFFEDIQNVVVVCEQFPAFLMMLYAVTH